MKKPKQLQIKSRKNSEAPTGFEPFHIDLRFFSDVDYIVHLNLTSEHFTEDLKSNESLEFLNMAEKIQMTVRSE